MTNLRRLVGHREAGSGEREDFYALRDVSFEIKEGQRVGIIGRNGAGKSTLLKVLSRITEPTTGRVILDGRVTSLLEVGTGFHPELTGRENIYLNGAILGMKRAEINSRFDEIVAFAEVERFLDTPVKRYSSGMYVRLAFAVAAHLEPEILIVDEVLAVGDLQFQQKCLGKMRDVSTSQGRTVLFVSHNMDAVRKLCNAAMMLEQGRMTCFDSVENVTARYTETGQGTELEYHIPPPKDQPAAHATKLVVEDHEGNPVAQVLTGQLWQIRVHFTVVQRVAHFMVALGFLTESNAPMRTSWSRPMDLEPGTYEAVFREQSLLLTSGAYPITVGLSLHERPIHHVENAAYLHIAEVSNNLDLPRVRGVGLILNPLQVDVIKAGAREHVVP